MGDARPFRFGAGAFIADSMAQWREQACRTEALGYDTLLIPDHFGKQLAPGPALTAAALATTTLRVGTTVYANDYRHPLVLAKEAASIDVLSDGRLEFGIGAGWTKREYDELGIPFDPPGVRVERMQEAIQIVRGV
jgi:probable F420-dependent oxidoreductase